MGNVYESTCIILMALLDGIQHGRYIHKLPYQTHRWLLEPLTDQLHIRYQSYARDNILCFAITLAILLLLNNDCVMPIYSN